jgi:hypothetical protein
MASSSELPTTQAQYSLLIGTVPGNTTGLDSTDLGHCERMTIDMIVGAVNADFSKFKGHDMVHELEVCGAEAGFVGVTLFAQARLI